ncbi:hypothetical protein MMC27_003850 [Xylographa pallens]|nr:hypothetical protein [Xylographa pallens]
MASGYVTKFTNDQQLDGTMVYDWSSQEVYCRRMIVDEGMTQDEVLAALRTVGFAPSKRAFQNQIARWNFLPSRIPASKNLALIEVVKELWKQHVRPAEMLRVLNEEKGFMVKKKELNNLRHSLGLYFRAPNVPKGQKTNAGALDGADDKAGGEKAGVVDDDRGNAEDTIRTTTPLHRDEFYLTDRTRDLLATIDRPHRLKPSDLTDLAVPPSTSQLRKRKRADSSTLQLASAIQASNPSKPGFLSPGVAARHAMRDEADTAEAASIAFHQQRPHRHYHPQTPAVGRGSRAPGTRYPSEMTLDEVKACLKLDHDTYRAVRDSFEEICVAKNIDRKKGSAGWQTAKDSLITSTPALYPLFNVTVPPAPNAFTQIATAVPSDQQVHALDNLCMDVTKQMRNRSVRMSVADSKKVLGLDPARVTAARSALTQRLIANEFLSRTESGEYWKVIRDEWIAEQGLQTDVDSMKAADVLCADVMKRFTENRTKPLRLLRTNRLQTREDKTQIPLVDEADREEHAKEKEEHAKGTPGKEESRGEAGSPGGHTSLPIPAFPHHPYPPGGYVSLPMPLSAMAAFSATTTAAHHLALSSATPPRQTMHTDAPNAAPSEGFQNLYPEIDPAILAMHGSERQP